MKAIFAGAMCLLLTCSFARAQSKQNETVTLKVFYEGSKAEKEYITRPTLIKVNPLLIFNGEIPLIVEHRIFKGASLQLAAGPTIRPYVVDIPEFGSSSSDPDPKYDLRNKYSYMSPGVTLRAEARVYLEGMTSYPEGMYVSLQGRFKNYNYIFQGPEGDNHLKMRDRFTDVLGSFGKQTEVSRRFFIDSYFGVGYRIKRQELVNVGVGSNGLIYGKSVISRTIPIYSLGFNVGYRIGKIGKAK